MQLIPFFAVVLFTSNMMTLFLNVCNLPEVVLHYDTTFNIGDFYLSILVFQHPIFENGRTISLAYLMHYKKTYELNKLFFETFKSHLKNETFDMKIVTDRESAITKAIRMVLPQSKLFFCWNHIIRDVEYWLKTKKNSDIGNVMVYKNNVWDLLDSDTEVEFHKKYNKLSLMWSQPFKDYFQNNLFYDILTSSKWVLNDPSINIYEERTGITNNPSESFNAVLKRLFQSEVQAQVCAVSIYQLSLHYEKEICRGMCKLGEYQLKSKYVKKFFMKPEDMVYPDIVIDLKNVPYCFQNKDNYINPEEDKEKVSSVFSLAKMLILENKVKHLPQDGMLLVGNEKYAVNLNPDSCTCKLRKKCHHIEAVKISCNFINIKQDQVKLRTLLRKTRGVRSGIKKVPKNVTIVEASDDSELLNVSLNSNTKNDFILVPTSVKGNKVVKKRLVLFEENDNNCVNDDITVTPPKHFSTPVTKLRINSTKNQVSFEQHTGLKKKSKQSEFGELYKEYCIFGRRICQTHLVALDRQISTVSNINELYIYGQTICVYLTLLSREEDRSVNFFVCEDFYMSNYSETQNSHMNETILQVGLEEFLSYQIPEYDIVLMPVTRNEHNILIVVLTKSKTVLYLDSFHSSIKKQDISLALNYLKMYEEFHNRPFSIDQYKVYVPNVPQQYNGYDCGAFACMFGEAIIKSNIDACHFVEGENLLMYRKNIKEKLLGYINNNVETVGPKLFDYNKHKFKNYRLELNINLYSDVEIIRGTPYEVHALDYLMNIAFDYWDSVICAMENNCKDPLNTSKSYSHVDWVYCGVGRHWYHLICLETEKEYLPEVYVCDKCNKL